MLMFELKGPSDNFFIVSYAIDSEILISIDSYR
jgi:hypothetical protein